MSLQSSPSSPYQAPQAPFAPPQKTSGLAISSLVTGILGLGIVPVVLGHIALSQIKKAAGTLQGRGLAIAGLIMGYLQIAVLIVLIPILFIGARAWKKGSDRATCIMNQRNLSQSMRGYQGINNLAVGNHIEWEEIIRKFLDKEPVCPSGGTYAYSNSVPAPGELGVKCSLAESDGHEPTDHSNW